MSRIRCAALVGVLVAVFAVPVARADSRADAAAVQPECAPMADAVTAVPAPVPPVGAAACTSVRPGDFISTEFGGTTKYCTVGFFYKDRRGDTYFLTGGKCPPPFVFEDTITTWKRGSGPAVMDGRTGSRIGEFAFRFGDGPVSMSLVRVDPAVPASPQVCQYGGPTGVTTALTADPTQLAMVGPQGGFLSWDARPYAQTDVAVLRPGLAHYGLYDKDIVVVTGESLSEDGMPVMTSDGLAVGIAEMLGSDEHPPAYNVGMVVIRPARAIAHAERVMRTTFTMLTAPLL